jgi:hypothetical protein
MFFTKRSPQSTIFLNILAEFIGSALFSLLFFVFISRFLSPEFKTSYALLSFNIGLAFLAAVFIPLHTYRIHIIPFISIIAALRKRHIRIVVHKLPAQISGAFLGVLISFFINENTINEDIYKIKTTEINIWATAVLNGFISAIVCYSFYMIRVFFKAKAIVGTIALSSVVAIIFYLSFQIAGITALNPFGLFLYDAVSTGSFYSRDWPQEILIHLISPIIFAYFTFYFVKDMGKRKVTDSSKIPVKNLGMRVKTEK